MQIYNNQNKEKIICPQLTCILLIFVYTIILINNYTESIFINYISLFIIFIYASILYIINKGIKYRNYNKYIYGLFLSVIYSIVSTLLKIIFILCLALVTDENNNNNNNYNDSNETEELFRFYFFCFYKCFFRLDIDICFNML